MNNKGIIFAGCSFTFGYGLNYYSPNFAGKWEQPYPGSLSYHMEQPSMKFQEKNRFSNMVTSHFNVPHLQPERVSGGDYVNVEWLEDLFWKRDNADTETSFKNIDFKKDFKLVIFQTSYVNRNSEFNYKQLLNVNKEFFKSPEEIVAETEKMRELDIENDFQWESNLQNQNLKVTWDKVKHTCKRYENAGINVYFLHIQDLWKDIDDDFLKDRHIPIYHRGKEYFSFDELTNLPNSLIATDFNSFGDTPPKDFHPSISTHKSVSESIIKRIQHEFE